MWSVSSTTYSIRSLEPSSGMALKTYRAAVYGFLYGYASRLLTISSRLSSRIGSRHINRVLVRPQPVRGTRASRRSVLELAMLAGLSSRTCSIVAHETRSSDRAPAVLTRDLKGDLLGDASDLF